MFFFCVTPAWDVKTLLTTNKNARDQSPGSFCFLMS
jgi:hypothetical protein